MKWRYFFLGFASSLVLVIGGLVIVFFVVKSEGEKSIKESLLKTDDNTVDITAFSIAKEALDSLQFKDLQTGAVYSVTKDTNNYVFINYWATWCAPCIIELPELEVLINSNKENFIGIKFAFASREKEENLMKFITTRNLSLSFYSYQDDEHPGFINHSSIPTSYFIDKNQLIVYKFSGLKNWNTEFYKNLLRSLK